MISLKPYIELKTYNAMSCPCIKLPIVSAHSEQAIASEAKSLNALEHTVFCKVIIHKVYGNFYDSSGKPTTSIFEYKKSYLK